MRSRSFAALAAVAGVAVLVGVLGGGAVPVGWNTPALAQQAPQPGGPGGPGYGPNTPGYGPGYGPRWFGPGYGPGFGRGPMMYGGGRGVRGGLGFGATVFALGVLLRFLLLVALLVIAWKVIGLRTLWNRPDGAVQVVRERFARGEINEEEYRKRLAAL